MKQPKRTNIPYREKKNVVPKKQLKYNFTLNSSSYLKSKVGKFNTHNDVTKIEKNKKKQ